jgi:D-alanyl-lipoteichoic acid acyltransferase DltB (MBOAT superfamily)
MVFNSLHFAGFFLVVYGLYRVLPHRPQNWLLLIASYYFYAAWDWRFLGLLVASTVVDFCCGLYIASRESPHQRKIALIVSIAFNLSMLGFFKYFKFFAANLHGLFGLFGWKVDFITLRVLLPIGISFYTFITMSYVIDVYRRHIEPTRNFLEFAVFVAYFPHLVAGPILRASLLLPQIAARRTISRSQMVEGAWLVGWGLFKKMFVADNLARVADAVFAAGGHPSGLEVLLGTYAFAFQIYGDFSGYSDIARGVSKLMGIELNINFRFPYFVRSPQEFWQHWHISLSTWLRDYVFLPLSYSLSRTLDGVRWLGLRDDFWIYATGTMITMIAAGLWHGAAWNFVLWGVYQGLLLVAFVLVGGRKRRRRPRGAGGSQLARALGMAAMFHLTCYGWLIFRAKSLPQIGDLTADLFARFHPSIDVLAARGLPLLFYATPLLVVHAFEAAHDDLAVVLRWPLLVRYGVWATMIYLIVLFGDFAGAQFIYFQF